MITQSNFDQLRIELSVKAKNGLDFIAAASIVWLIIGYLWTLRLHRIRQISFNFLRGRDYVTTGLVILKDF
jgi:hypothetical protein